MKVKGQLKSNFFFAITLNDFAESINDNSLSLYKNSIQNNIEKISDNTYFYFVGIKISQKCGPGQYYDNNKLI